MGDVLRSVSARTWQGRRGEKRVGNTLLHPRILETLADMEAKGMLTLRHGK